LYKFTPTTKIAIRATRKGAMQKVAVFGNAGGGKSTNQNIKKYKHCRQFALFNLEIA
jgi:hypothetical protein